MIWNKQLTYSFGQQIPTPAEWVVLIHKLIIYSFRLYVKTYRDFHLIREPKITISNYI